MKKADLELYTDYLISTFGQASATGLSAMVDGDVSHDRVTRFLSEREYTSKDLWKQVQQDLTWVDFVPMEADSRAVPLLEQDYIKAERMLGKIASGEFRYQD